MSGGGSSMSPPFFLCSPLSEGAGLGFLNFTAEGYPVSEAQICQNFQKISFILLLG